MKKSQFHTFLFFPNFRWTNFLCLFVLSVFSSICVAQTITNGIYTIQLSNRKALEIDITKTKVNGQYAMVWDANGGENQKWKIESVGGNKYKITCVKDGKSLDASASKVNNNGCHVGIWDYHGGPNQTWIIKESDDEVGRHNIFCSSGGKALEALGGSMKQNGGKVNLWDFHGGANQIWELNRVSASNISTIQLKNIEEWLCPKALLKGDREFDGHGPKIKCDVKIYIGNSGKSLFADIYFWAQETQSDWSTTERRWSKKVDDAPDWKTIAEIKSEKFSRNQFISPPAGFQLLGPSADVMKYATLVLTGTIADAVLEAYDIPKDAAKHLMPQLITGYNNDGNSVTKVPTLDGTLVRFFHIVGDTGGPDISTDDNCKEDTRIVKLEFNPVQVIFR